MILYIFLVFRQIHSLFPFFRLPFFRIQITVLHSLVPVNVSNNIAFEWPFIKVNRDCFLIPSGWRNLWNGCQTAIVSIQMHLNVIQLKYFRERVREWVTEVKKKTRRKAIAYYFSRNKGHFRVAVFCTNTFYVVVKRRKKRKTSRFFFYSFSVCMCSACISVCFSIRPFWAYHATPEAIKEVHISCKPKRWSATERIIASR